MRKPKREFGLNTVLLAGFVLSACGDGATGPHEPATSIPTSISLDAAQHTFFIGETQALQASVRDQFGQEMRASVTWASDDRTVAEVSATGVVTAVDAGITKLVASVAGISESVRIDVRFPVARDEIRMRVRGAIDATWSWSYSWVVHGDVLGSGADYTSMFLFEKGSWYDTRDGWVSQFILPAEPRPGIVNFETWDVRTELSVPGADFGKAIAYIGRHEGADRFVFFADRGTSWVELEDVDAPPGAGNVPGQMSGRIVFEGEGYEALLDGNGDPVSVTPNGKHLTLHGDFSRWYFQYPVGTAAATISGGPFAGTYALSGIGVDYRWGDGLFNPRGYVLDYQGDQGDYLCSLEMRIPEVSPGTYAVTYQDPTSWFFDWDSAEPWMVGEFLFDPSHATLLKVGTTQGTLVVDEMVHPGGELTGEMKGRLTVELIGWTNSGWSTGDVMQLDLTFHAPIWGSGPTSSAPDGPGVATPGAASRTSPPQRPIKTDHFKRSVR